MKNVLKALFINILILSIGLLLIEVFMGGWFFKKNQLDNLNIIRDKEYVYQSDLYTKNLIDVHYTRDKFGLRGKSSFNAPNTIDILTIGGSTTDQRYITDGETWQDVIEKCYKQDGKNIVVANAGIDGQSTFGHLKDFEVWFPQIPQLKPKYIIFYIGINDFYKISYSSSYDVLDLNEASTLASLKENTKRNSIIYNFYMKMSGWNQSYKSKVGHRKIDFSKITYTDKGIASEKLYNLYNANLTGLESRLNKLIDYSNTLGAEPIFVTQPSLMYKLSPKGNVQGTSQLQYLDKYSYNGVDYFNLMLKLNGVILKVCGDKYTVIDLTKTSIWGQQDFYDKFHNSPLGAKKLGVEIYNKIKGKKI
ncbi:MAG: GDSL-like lipase/acylhydrolase family protein [Sphingobacteriales bacterium]|nr:GDSL-like lipase/acylhydrolase family protein [Sphingobacteriales bacterium]